MIVVDDPVATEMHPPRSWTGYPSRPEAQVTTPYPYQLRLPLAPYRFVWRDDAAVDAAKDATESYTQERYTHADGTTTIIREYQSDGSYHIMSDRGEIELIDNANDPYAADPVSVVRLP
jgi:hypothetical protein